MPLSRSDITQLIIKHLKEELSEEEKLQLEAFMQASPENQEQVSRLLNMKNVQQGLEQLYLSRSNVWQRLYVEIKPARKQLSVRWISRVAAIALLVLATAFTFLLVQQQRTGQLPASMSADIPAPSQTKAYITLANGKRITLDSVNASGGLSPRMTRNGIAYQQMTGVTDTYNTLTVPKGSKPVRMILADSTEVWVNVASSLTYSTSLSGPERVVEMTGEAYFNVTHNPHRPFIVKGKNAIVKVYGTVFNLNAYDDEQEIITTLLQGSIGITQPGSGASGMLKPGQQAAISRKGHLRITNHPNIEETVSWVKGKFLFENSDLQAILRQMSRWYDVEIVYEGKIEGKTFSADLSRDRSLVSMLRILEAGGIKATLEGRKVTVTP